MTTIKVSWHTIFKNEFHELFVYMSPSLVKRRPSVKTKYYKYFVPKQFTDSFYFHKNSNYWHKKSVKI